MVKVYTVYDILASKTTTYSEFHKKYLEYFSNIISTDTRNLVKPSNGSSQPNLSFLTYHHITNSV